MNLLRMSGPQVVDYASDPTTPVEDLITLSKDKTMVFREAVAFNPACPPQILDKLIEDTSSMVIAVAYAHPNLSEEGLRKLAAETREHILVDAITTREHPSQAFINTILTHPNDKIRADMVSYHPHAPEVLHQMVLNDTSFEVLTTIAAKEEILPETLTQLSLNPNSDVRQQVAWQPKTPLTTLVLLLDDVSHAVREVALRNKTLPKKYVSEYIKNVEQVATFYTLANIEGLDAKDYSLLYERSKKFLKETVEIDFLFDSLASNRSLTTEFIELLMNECSSNSILLSLAENASVASTILEKVYDKRLTQKIDYRVYQALGSNPNTPEHILYELFKDGKFDINEQLVRNPSLPLDMVQQIHAKGGTYSLVEWVAEQLWMKDPQFKNWPQDWVEAHFNVKLGKTNAINSWNDENLLRINMTA